MIRDAPRREADRNRKATQNHQRTIRPTCPTNNSGSSTNGGQEAKALFKGPDADGMIVHLVRFMEDHPALVAHLGIEHEYLFELGAELGRRKQWSRYADLLVRIRKAHPEVYVRSFGYYDYDVIIELIADGTARAYLHVLHFFHQYPDYDPDNAHKVIELLAWTGLQDELFEFVRPIAVPICRVARRDRRRLRVAMAHPGSVRSTVGRGMAPRRGGQRQYWQSVEAIGLDGLVAIRP